MFRPATAVPSGVKQGTSLVDKISKLAFGEKETAASQGKKDGQPVCCGSGKFGAGV